MIEKMTDTDIQMNDAAEPKTLEEFVNQAEQMGDYEPAPEEDTHLGSVYQQQRNIASALNRGDTAAAARYERKMNQEIAAEARKKSEDALK